LRTGNVDLSRVRTIDGPNGIAIITVTDAGENAIVVAAGANAHVDAKDVVAGWLRASTVLVLQQEIPAIANTQLAARASKSGARIVLNAAPARAVDPDLLDRLDVIVVNETEMRALAADHQLPGDTAAFAEVLSQRHGLVAVVTLGAAGVLAADNGEIYSLPAPSVAVVDSTGAGDAFVGAMTAALARDCPLTTALTWAVAAGSLACTRPGAQPSLPYAIDIAPLATKLESQLKVWY
jgi:ribokinase